MALFNTKRHAGNTVVAHQISQSVDLGKNKTEIKIHPVRKI